MNKKLFIIESPNKIKTLQSFLREYDIIASVGHIRNILPKSNSVTVSDKLNIKWEYSKNFNKFENQIMSKKYETVLLATDNDLEGERIASDIKFCVLDKLNIGEIKRIRYNEISKNSIIRAIDEAGDLDLNMVDAALGRMCIDYIFGFGVSPVLWYKIPGAKSAGRVQSPSLGLIIEHYFQNALHIPIEFFTLRIDIGDSKSELIAEFKERYPTKLKLLFDLKSLYRDIRILSISSSYQKPYIAAPITTAELQKYCNSNFNWSGKHSMRVAQDLYEGLKVKDKVVSLITYIRTDSTYMTPAFSSSMSEYLNDRFRINKREVTHQPNKGAHECIRPVYPELYPSDIREYFSKDQYSLYEYIYYHTARYVMAPPVIEVLNVNVGNKRLNTSLITKKYIQVNSDIWSKTKLVDIPMLYELKPNQKISVKSFKVLASKTKRPAMLTESGLISLLQKLRIGKPSTYANITSVLLDRKYINRLSKTLIPTKLGVVLYSFLEANFTKYINVKFTAQMEYILDHIRSGAYSLINEVGNFQKELTENINNVSNANTLDFLSKRLRPDRYFSIWSRGKYRIEQVGMCFYITDGKRIFRYFLAYNDNKIPYIYAYIILLLSKTVVKPLINSKRVFVNNKRVINDKTLFYAVNNGD